jgi:hypothetical protein
MRSLFSIIMVPPFDAERRVPLLTAGTMLGARWIGTSRQYEENFTE